MLNIERADLIGSCKGAQQCWMNEELLELELRYGVQISTLIEVRDPLGNRESVSRDVEH